MGDYNCIDNSVYSWSINKIIEIVEQVFKDSELLTWRISHVAILKNKAKFVPGILSLYR